MLSVSLPGGTMTGVCREPNHINSVLKYWAASEATNTKSWYRRRSFNGRSQRQIAHWLEHQCRIVCLSSAPKWKCTLCWRNMRNTSCVYAVYSVGPRTEPWGTTARMEWQWHCSIHPESLSPVQEVLCKPGESRPMDAETSLKYFKRSRVICCVERCVQVR